MAHQERAEEVVQRQLDFYNKQDLDGFVSTYAKEVELLEHPSGQLLAKGEAALRDRYAKMFRENPNNHAEIKNRTVFGNYVIDLEEVTGRENRGPFQALAIYEVKEGLISRVWFLREEA
ncbi:nuclear transport factor 2 family protein [Brevibacillus fulvus]|uniref:SnoaL-like domain-containing protein n=1 Tax=Brevibacillus fulvus TaxID=1125967 RepID=A0A938XV97_9BACL|nr:nuclear transport factor 2 family protein [Brevibacillus fulvus]MBM7591113.1 hypothetical protein [Brevibacillus fulvus]